MIALQSSRASAARVIDAVMAVCGAGSELVSATEREWASATFNGARHSLDLLMPVTATDGLPEAVARLPDHEFDLPGEIVADCAVTLGSRARDCSGRIVQAARIELLTIVAD